MKDSKSPIDGAVDSDKLWQCVDIHIPVECGPGKSVQVEELKARIEEKQRKLATKKYIPAAIIAVLVVCLLAIQHFRDQGVSQSTGDIQVNMELMGYENIVFGKTVDMLGNHYGPCKTFEATFKGSVVKGGYCTPKFMIDQWGPKIIYREVPEAQSVINDSYKESK